MTTQEAKIKSNILRKPQNQTATELYFPTIRATYHSIFSGDDDKCNFLIPDSGTTLVPLARKYKQATKVVSQDAGLPVSDLPIKVEFTEEGIDFGVVMISLDDKGKKISDMKVFTTLRWDTDVGMLTTIAKLCDTVNLECTRIIPLLVDDFQNFKNIYQIETNPIFDFMAFTYALFHKLKLLDSIPKCYVQVLMGRRKTTYLALVQAVKFRTSLPTAVLEWFQKDIIKEKSYTTKSEQGKPDETINVWSLLLIDYAGKIFNHQLKLQVGPRQLNFEGSRNITIDTDNDVCPQLKVKV